MIKFIKKLLLKHKKYETSGPAWRCFAVIDISKPWDITNQRIINAMTEAGKVKSLNWRMSIDGNLCSFEAYCTEEEALALGK